MDNFLINTLKQKPRVSYFIFYTVYLAWRIHRKDPKNLCPKFDNDAYFDVIHELKNYELIDVVLSYKTDEEFKSKNSTIYDLMCFALTSVRKEIWDNISYVDNINVDGLIQIRLNINYKNRNIKYYSGIGDEWYSYIRNCEIETIFDKENMYDTLSNSLKNYRGKKDTSKIIGVFSSDNLTDFLLLPQIIKDEDLELIEKGLNENSSSFIINRDLIDRYTNMEIKDSSIKVLNEFFSIFENKSIDDILNDVNSKDLEYIYNELKNKKDKNELLEYLLSEILDLATNGARDLKNKYITKDIIIDVIENDLELKEIFSSILKSMKNIQATKEKDSEKGKKSKKSISSELSDNEKGASSPKSLFSPPRCIKRG